MSIEEYVNGGFTIYDLLNKIQELNAFVNYYEIQLTRLKEENNKLKNPRIWTNEGEL